MSDKKVVRRVLFHANAVALAAHIRSPREYFLQSVASSALPVTGGYAEAHAQHDQLGVFSYDRAFTSVLGEFVLSDGSAAPELKGRNYDDNDFPAHTILKASVTGLRIDAPADPKDGTPPRTLKIEYLGTEIRNFYDRKSPNAFRMMRVIFDGVSVDGKALIVKTNPDIFLRCDTWKKLDAEDSVRECRSSQILYHDSEDGVTLGTVVTGFQWADGVPDGLKRKLPPGHMLAIPGLGSLYFGEIYVEEGLRRLTLLRTQLGSTNGGCGSVVDAVSNTHTIPPR